MRRLLVVLTLCIFVLSSCDGLPVEIVVTIVPVYTNTPEYLNPIEPPVEIDPILTETPEPEMPPKETVEIPESSSTLATTFTKTPSLTTVDWLYELQPDSPVYIENFVHQEEGCDWIGAAGQVMDEFGYPVSNLVILIEAVINGEEVDFVGMTGAAEDYGPEGYEIKIGNEAFESEDIYKIAVYDLNGQQLSDKYSLRTYNDCENNLIVINYIEK